MDREKRCRAMIEMSKLEEIALAINRFGNNEAKHALENEAFKIINAAQEPYLKTTYKDHYYNMKKMYRDMNEQENRR